MEGIENDSIETAHVYDISEDFYYDAAKVAQQKILHSNGLG